MRALLVGPQLRPPLAANPHPALLLHVLHELHTPRFAQHQKLLKWFFGYHCSLYSTRFQSYYQLQTSRNRVGQIATEDQRPEEPNTAASRCPPNHREEDPNSAA